MDMLLGAAVLVPVGFVFPEEPRPLMPALQSPFFVPHVAAYVLSYVILLKAATVAAARLLRGDRPTDPRLASRDESAYRLVRLGFPLITAGLVLGAVWGKRAWGDWWNWDPKELWGLATWLIYVGYLHCRPALPLRRRTAAALLVLGAAFVVITLLWVNLSRLFEGLHSYA